ncbi:RES family NAD+ phosphorylase [Kitasatospora sp. NPDC091335]|uniref:RES family NAD+ phosphorylase n=1 Tax=Kitasatospora sp. NPDC091335 TaxID=3364085 RepID=UPI00382593CC
MTTAPRRHLLPRGTVLHRVHRSHRSPVEFNPGSTGGTPRGGRFDSTSEEPYPYYYAALSPRTAVFEVFLDEGRDGPAEDPKVGARNRVISAVELTVDACLVSLAEPGDLAAVGQGEWLVRGAKEDYRRTRQWARALRATAPWAQGLVWRSSKDSGARSVVLFGDRLREGALRPLPGSSRHLDEEPHFQWLVSVLAEDGRAPWTGGDPARTPWGGPAAG